MSHGKKDLTLLSGVRAAITEFILSRPHPGRNLNSKLLANLSEKAWLRLYWFILEYSEHLPPERLFKIQEKRLLTLIDRAQSIPFYHKRLNGVRNLTDFQSVPLLTKDDIRKELEAGTLINKQLERYKITRSTSGSSGTPLLFFHDNSMYTRRIAFYHRLLRWAGYQKKPSNIVVWIMREPHPKSGAIPFVCSGPEDIEARKHHLYKLLEGKTVILHAMVSHLIFLADLLEKDKKTFIFKSIISYGESLYPEIRHYLERKFQSPIFDYYASQEILTHGQECEEHQGFHINTEWAYVEILDSQNKPTEPGKPGSIAITSFDNEFMPFIRYKLGDIGYWIKEKCPCGRTLPRLQLLARSIHYFIHPNGKVGDFSSLVSPLMYAVPKILEFQVIRNSRFDFSINVVATTQFDKSSRETVLNKIQEYLGPDASVKLECIKNIPRTSGGKTKAFINMQDDLPK